MALPDELTALLAHAGRGVLDDARSFAAALDDYLSPEVASRGVVNLLVDAVRQGAVDRLLRDIAHGADPARAVESCGDQLARDRAANEAGPSRWAVAVLGYAAGAVDRRVLDQQVPPETSTSVPTAPPAPPGPPVPPVPQGPPLAMTQARPGGPPPQWTPGASVGRPPHTPQEPVRRRTGLIVAGVVLALLVLVGVAVAIVLVSGDDPRVRVIDDDSTGASPTDSTSQPTDDPTTASTLAADPAAIAQLLIGVAEDSFPDGGGPPEVSATSWSVEAENVPDGYPRDLAEGEREQATSWMLRDDHGANRFNITIAHIPADAEEWFETTCDDFVSTDESEVECRDFETSDGRAGVEFWYRYASAGIASHQVLLSGDLATGVPQVTVGERLVEPADDLTLATMKSRFLKTEDDLRSIAINSRLVLPRPAQTPPLPSYDHCISTTPLPSECPEGLS